MEEKGGTPEIFITRHGEREDVVDRLWFQKSQRSYDDPPLAEKGRKQASELAQRLAKEKIDHIFSSPFERCVETAHIISSAREKPLPIKLENGICEVLWDFPPGYLSAEEHKKKFPLVDASYKSAVIPTSGESYDQDCRHRVSEAVTKIETQHEGNLLFVAHGASVGALVETFTGSWGYIGLCTLTHLVPDGNKRWKSTIRGDASHLSDKSNLRPY